MLVVLTGNALVFRERQIPQASMYADSFVVALFFVSFFSLPSVTVFMLVARTKMMIVACGAGLAGVICWGWWEASESWHSTASLGPFFAGFFVGPAALVAVLLFGRGVRRAEELLGRRIRS